MVSEEECAFHLLSEALCPIIEGAVLGKNSDLELRWVSAPAGNF